MIWRFFLALFWEPIKQVFALRNLPKEVLDQLPNFPKLVLIGLVTSVIVIIISQDFLQQIITWVTITLPQWLKRSAAISGIIFIIVNYIAGVSKEFAQIKSDKDRLLAEVRARKDDLAKEVDQLKLQVEEQQQRIGLTASHNSLVDFVTARLNQEDYNQHLGLMQQVRRDLEDLSNRITPGHHNLEQLKKFFPRGPARVILYIDDLDRCPPNRVVEVLEAVQLLLKTRLFIVVLAVDDRYIARALEQVYQGVLKRKGKPSGIDYLEKIIQIPYRMRPISPATIEDYLKSQVVVSNGSANEVAKPSEPAAQPVTPPLPINPSQPTQPSNRDTLATVKPASQSAENEVAPVPYQSQDKSKITSPMPDLDTSSIPEPDIDQPPSEKAYEEPTVDSDADLDQPNGNILASTGLPAQNTLTFPPSQTSNAVAEPTLNKTPESSKGPHVYLETLANVTEFDADEFQLLVDCCKYVDITPRTAKRLINIYKILQIIWQKREQAPDLERRRLVMSCLALSGRYPEFMRSLFEEIDVLLEEEAFSETSMHGPVNPSITKPLNKLFRTIQPHFQQSDVHAKREWRRFENDIKRMLRDPTTVKVSSGRAGGFSIWEPLKAV